jgi:hypothetical protein
MFVPRTAILGCDTPIEILQRIAMPQIWMTYEELAGMLDCTVTEVRERVHLERLDRKISRDGKRRAKLSAAMIEIFIERLKTIDCAMNRAVEDLRQVHGLLSEGAGQPRQLPPFASHELITGPAGTQRRR